MPCNDDVRDWMIAAIDGDDRPELAEHLAGCPACRDEWQRLTAIDRLLRDAPAIEPPPGLAVRVERHMTRELDGNLGWKHTLANVGLVVAAVATGLFAVATLSLRDDLGSTAGRLLRAPALDQVLELAASAARGPLGLLVAGALAAGLAMAWFAVLFVPRLAPRVDRT